jgi:hypothetical protein
MAVSTGSSEARHPVAFDSARDRYYSSSQGNIRQLVFSDYLQTSMMSDPERATLIMLLDKIRPMTAIEIGTADGGSLSIIAKYAKCTYSLDVDPTCEARFNRQFPNTTFVVGDSKQTLPALLDGLDDLEFVLIDGLHTAAGVQADIESLLNYKPRRDVWIAMHDSFNPECRRGMRNAAWASSRYVHAVELDFVSGQYDRPEGSGPRQMWCGLGLALMRPEERAGDLIVNEDKRALFDAVFALSIHNERGLAKVAKRARYTWRRLNQIRQRLLAS